MVITISGTPATEFLYVPECLVVPPGHYAALDDSGRRDEYNEGDDSDAWSPLTLIELNLQAPIWK
jgi:hypothetical protein